MASQHDDNLIWMDLEMTGLDPYTDSILQIATIVTDAHLNVLAEGPEIAIRHPEERLQAMDDWNRSHHGSSGLWQAVVTSDHDHARAERETLDFISQWVPAGKSPLCGNTICQDRRFLYRQMPTLERYFFYRNVDVSTLKELARRWAPKVAAGFHKATAHTAMSDIRDSIDELRYYRRTGGGWMHGVEP